MASHTPPSPPLSHSLPLSDRATACVQAVREALKPLVLRFAGPAMRPATLARAVAIDPSLAARIIRIIKANEIGEVIHDLPSPEGLRIFLNAAAVLLPDPAMLNRARRCTLEFEILINQVPGGRAGLDMLASDSSTPTRRRLEHSARQAIFKSMSTLMGFYTEQTLETAIIQPSPSSPRACDTIFLLGKYGIRRIRPGGRITVYGRQVDDVSTPDAFSPALRLDGSAATDATDYLFAKYCTQPLPELMIARRPGIDLCVLPEHLPASNESVSLVGAQRVQHSGDRPLTTADPPWSEGFVSRLPSRFLLFDLFVREDTFRTNPTLTSTLYGFAPPNLHPQSDTFRLDEVSLSGSIDQLGRGLPDVSCTQIPTYAAMIDDAFADSGWDRSRFIGYRFQMRYPIPLVKLTYWFFGDRSHLLAPTTPENGANT